MTRAHPRGCGADPPLPRPPRRRGGSSPRVRGRRYGYPQVQGVRGLIPAGAGQTPNLFLLNHDSRAHPRGCGADDFGYWRDVGFPGPSPRVRGRRHWGTSGMVLRGLIPAGAGQTRRMTAARAVTRAHPRGCGADPSILFHLCDPSGSSPRVRGRLADRVTDATQRRLIPAGAGQTCSKHPGSTRMTAHPRGCGADVMGSVGAKQGWGSSPRVRGRHRLTSGFLSTIRAHPRGCGADNCSKASCIAGEGSSPRVRGRHHRACLHTRLAGLIPAGAGQT